MIQIALPDDIVIEKPAGITAAEASPLGQEAKLQASDASEHDSFGRAVALNGDTALVGSVGHSQYANQTGAAYVFDTAEWLEPLNLKPIVVVNKIDSPDQEIELLSPFWEDPQWTQMGPGGPIWTDDFSNIVGIFKLQHDDGSPK